MSGAVSLGALFTKMFGVPLAVEYAKNISDFYTTVGPTKKVHLDASSITDSVGSQLTTWPGSDGQASATAVSGTGSTKPTIQTIGSYKHVNFSAATQQYFTLPSMTFTFRDAGNNPINGLTVLIVARRSTTAGNWERYFDFGNGSAADNILLARPGTNASLVALEIFNGSTYITSRSITGTDGQWYVYAGVVTNGNTLSYALYMNGTNSGVGTVNNGSATDGPLNNKTISTNYLGKSNWADAYLNGDIRELIVINNALSASQVTKWSNYLKSKWGI